jgi:formylmethanofuran dehydrogenase subunit B
MTSRPDAGNDPAGNGAAAVPTVTCPFCGLACDDLVVAGGKVDAKGCATAAAGFARAEAARLSHAVAGKPADLAAAVGEAVGILRRAARPLFHGLTSDLDGVRAVLALADRTGGTVDHRNSAGLLANAAVARASGWVAATFGEIANRADFVLLVAADPARNFPRFHERLVRNATPLYRKGPPSVAYLGSRELAPSPEVAPLQAIVAETDLLPALAALGSLLRDRSYVAADLPSAALATIAARLKAARYGVIAWDVSAFAPDEAEYAVERLASMLRHLNVETRCVGLPLGGSGNGLGAQQAALWQAGWPLRIGFGEGTARHDPWRYDGRRMIEAGEADALVWVATLVAEPPPVSGIPIIAIVSDDVALRSPAAVELRVGIPALDHGGEIVRSDTIIALPLQATRPTDRPSVADIARALLAGLEAAP